MPQLTLTSQQDFAITHAVKYVVDWIKGNGNARSVPHFRLGGWAGTGKTTVSVTIMDQLQNQHHLIGQPCAFTGKAVSVLRRKGVVDAQTIHSIIYRPYEDQHGNIKFELRSQRSIVDDLGIDYFLIDEGSMLSKELYDDLLKVGLPMVVVGDPGQLEPVGDDPNLMKNPDFTLTEIHRQAAASPIIKFSMAARGGTLSAHPWVTGSTHRNDESTVEIYRKTTDRGYERELDLALRVDQIIVPTNKERCTLNKLIRFRKGHRDILEPGERIICLENNRDFGVFNGQVMTTVDVVPHPDNSDYLLITCEDEVGHRYYRLPSPRWMFGEHFGKDQKMPDYDRRAVTLFDYAYAMTCHKSQGSEWDSVLVVETYYPAHFKLFDMKRWTYTAITRAAKQLYYGRKY